MHILWTGGKEQAKPLLSQARDGFVKLEQARMAAHIDGLLQPIDSAA